MTINANGSLGKEPGVLSQRCKLRPIHDKAKFISSIFIDHSTKVDEGFLLTKENMNTTMKRLIKYLKQHE